MTCCPTFAPPAELSDMNGGFLASDINLEIACRQFVFPHLKHQPGLFVVSG